MITQLSGIHRQEWIHSGVSSEIIDRNVWTIEDARDVDQLLNRNDKSRWKHSYHLVPGWAVAGVDPTTGERTYRGAQFKPDTPSKDEKTGKAQKYLSPSKQTLSPLFLEMEDRDYWQHVKNDIHQAIALTEGAKKAGALMGLSIPAISIPGVSTGAKLGRLRPELEHFCTYGRTFRLFFDRDIIEKHPVRQALHNLARLLTAKGCVVEVVEWPNQFKGIDDYIAAGGDVGARIEKALTIEEWREETKPEAPSVDGEICTLARRYEMVAKRLKGRLRWNRLKGKLELDGEPVELTHIRLKLAIEYNIQLPTEDCAQICLYLAQMNAFSPVGEYLEDCAHRYPADEGLLNGLAETYFGTDSELHRTFLRKTLISAVARALIPGCKVDTVCILQGIQGCGKSTFWKILAGEDWFDDTVSSASDKDERMKLHQSWFIEWAELEAIFKRKDISAVKAFITTQTDQVRPPYGRDILDMQRPSIIVGSTNESDFLADPTGNRRYWIIPVQHAEVPLAQLAEERDRIWAAAVHAFKSGETWTLPAELRTAARLESADYVYSDPWESIIFEYCSNLTEITTVEILTNALKLELHQMDKRSEMRVTTLLKQNGWRSARGRHRGVQIRIWKNPKFEKEVVTGCHSTEVVQDKTPVSKGLEGVTTSETTPVTTPCDNPQKTANNPRQATGDSEGCDNVTTCDNPFSKSTGTQGWNKSTPDKPLNISMAAWHPDVGGPC